MIYLLTQNYYECNSLRTIFVVFWRICALWNLQERMTFSRITRAIRNFGKNNIQKNCLCTIYFVSHGINHVVTCKYSTTTSQAVLWAKQGKTNLSHDTSLQDQSKTIQLHNKEHEKLNTKTIHSLTKMRKQLLGNYYVIFKQCCALSIFRQKGLLKELRVKFVTFAKQIISERLFVSNVLRRGVTASPLSWNSSDRRATSFHLWLVGWHMIKPLPFWSSIPSKQWI